MYDVEISDETNLVRVVVFVGDTRHGWKNSPEDLSELAGGDTIRREKILIYYTRDFPN
jgi:hypothetical protein